jgi:hypothetical protein
MVGCMKTFFLVLLVLAACGDDSTPVADAGRSDAGHSDGGSVSRDAAVGTDAQPGEDAGEVETDAGAIDAGSDAGAPGVDAGCVPPPCPAPPEGCMYVGTDPCVCGTLVCAGSCGLTECSVDEYCAYSVPYSCGGDGTCMPRPGACPRIYRPVCGCDGATHSNDCIAHGAGTDVAAEGECGGPPPPPDDCRVTGCPAGSSCELCRGGVYVCLPAGTAC